MMMRISQPVLVLAVEWAACVVCVCVFVYITSNMK